MNRLVRLYACNFLTTEKILKVGDNLNLLDLDMSNQLDDEDIWASISDLEKLEDTLSFFSAIRNFTSLQQKRCW
jgi:hypothetical protein